MRKARKTIEPSRKLNQFLSIQISFLMRARQTQKSLIKQRQQTTICSFKKMRVELGLTRPVGNCLDSEVERTHRSIWRAKVSQAHELK